MSYFKYQATWTVEEFEMEVGSEYYESQTVKNGFVAEWAQRISRVYDTRSGRTFYLRHDRAALR